MRWNHGSNLNILTTVPGEANLVLKKEVISNKTTIRNVVNCKTLCCKSVLCEGYLPMQVGDLMEVLMQSYLPLRFNCCESKREVIL